MMELKRIGHVLLRVRNLERSRAFYTAILGFEVMEQDPEHGGLFMALPGHAHTLDLFPVADPDGAQPRWPAGLESSTSRSRWTARRPSRLPTSPSWTRT